MAVKQVPVVWVFHARLVPPENAVLATSDHDNAPIPRRPNIGDSPQQCKGGTTALVVRQSRRGAALRPPTRPRPAALLPASSWDHGTKTRTRKTSSVV